MWEKDLKWVKIPTSQGPIPIISRSMTMTKIHTSQVASTRACLPYNYCYTFSHSLKPQNLTNKRLDGKLKPSNLHPHTAWLWKTANFHKLRSQRSVILKDKAKMPNQTGINSFNFVVLIKNGYYLLFFSLLKSKVPHNPLQESKITQRTMQRGHTQVL